MAEAIVAARISKEDIRRYFQRRNIPFNETAGEITAEFKVQTITGTQYTLRLYIPRDFPNSVDAILAVIDPRCLLQRNETAIPQNASDFKTLGRTTEGFQIISVSSSSPNAAVFVHQIFMESTLWVNAHAEHLATGVNLAQHIQQCLQTENQSPSSPVQFWSDAQTKRLAKEKGLLDDFFAPQFVEWSHDRRTVTVTIKSLQENTYVLEVHLHHDFPNSLPTLSIAHPQELFQVNGEPLPVFSSDFATLGKKHDRLIICHFRPNEWLDNCKITHVILKGMVWVNAYEQYLLQADKTLRDCVRELFQCSSD